MNTFVKWLGRILICFVIIVFAIGALTWLQNRAMSPPSVKDAPWAIQTFSNDEFKIPSRVYYTEIIEIQQDGTPVIRNYWNYDGERYHRYRGEKSFPVDLYGNIQIVRRGQ